MALPTKRQVSAGGVVLRRQGLAWDVVLIARKQHTVWCLPKGHLEPGEQPEQAALREVREETGLTAEILQLLDSIAYWFSSTEEHARFFKTVHFYLMRATGGSTDDHDTEVDEVRWVPVAEALTIMTYPSERKLVTQAQQILDAG